MHLILETKTIEGIGTFGTLKTESGQFVARTVERDWLDNKPNVSCIPSGTYTVEPRHSEKYDDHYILSNDYLGVGKEKGLRTHILIHVANWPDELAGCIGVGRNWMIDAKGRFAGGVTHSAVTMAELRKLLGEGTHTLDIIRL